MTLKRRLAALETATVAKGRQIIVVGSDSMDVDAELERCGLVSAPADLVVAVRGKKDGWPVTVKVDGVLV